MANLHSFYEPIHESTVFGNLWGGADDTIRRDFFQEKEDILEDKGDSALSLEEKEELRNLQGSLQKARSMVKTELDRYHDLKDVEEEYIALRHLIEATLEDTLRKLEFLKDAYQKKLNLEACVEEEDHQKACRENLMALKDLMLHKVQAECQGTQQALSASKTKLRMLSEFCSVQRRVSQVHFCPICYQKEIDVYCDPCGHTFCSDCIKTNYCYLCRCRINKVSKLFFT